MNKITHDIIHIAHTQTRSRSSKKNTVADFDELLFKDAFKKYIDKNECTENEIVSLIESLFNLGDEYNKRIALAVSEYSEIPAKALEKIIIKYFGDEKYDSELILYFVRIIEDNKIINAIPIIENLTCELIKNNSDIASRLITVLYTLDYKEYIGLLSKLISIDINKILDKKSIYSITGTLVTNLIISSNSEDEVISLFHDLNTLPVEQKKYIYAETRKALSRIKGLGDFKGETFVDEIHNLTLSLLPTPKKV